MKRLPIGIQSFGKLREGGYLYVDKTREIYQLVSEAGYYFLSRPRRFGKSLMISTFKELFSGNKELFKGLWIEDQWDWKTKHPVLHISFSSLGYKSLGLERALLELLDEVIEEHGLEVREESLEKKFREVLESLSANARVVLLIDEYDKPIIDYLGEEIEQARENQQILKKFYSVIKDSDPWLRFVFITGVSKFSRVSIFSDLNNLNDITMSPRHSTLLGYTQAELEHFFADHLRAFGEKSGMSRKEGLSAIKNWYNGYSWDGREFVYNPFSILLLFYNGVFSNYWFKTATPTFLVHLIREKVYYDFDGIRVGETAFDSFDIEHLNVETILFQTGYLTIREYDAKRLLYTLRYPNKEVKQSMLEYLIDTFSEVEHTRVRSYVLEVEDALQEEDLEKVREIFNILLYSLPNQLHQNEERFYHAIVHLFFKYMGLDVHSEVNTSRGRADALVILEDKVYCFEFKLNKTAVEALEQIQARGYLDKYRDSGKKLIAVGVNFSTEKREVDELLVEVL